MTEKARRARTHTIVIENRLSDFIVIISLRETSQKHFVITFSREPMKDHREVVEEWYLRKGSRCSIELEDDEVSTLDDRLKLLFDYAASEDDAGTHNTIVILDMLQ